MDGLSQDLLRQFCGKLPIKDIKCFRLTCKHFATVGASCLIPEIHLMFQWDSFEKLYRIASHPVLARHVHSLFYEADLLADQDREWWEERLQIEELEDLDDAMLMTAPTSEAKIEEAYELRMERVRNKLWNEFQNRLADQNLICRRELDRKWLVNALGRVRALKKLYLSLNGCVVHAPRKARSSTKRRRQWLK